MEDDHCKRVIHAEINSLMRLPVAYSTGATIYVTHFPCLRCAKHLVKSGIARVVYGEMYESRSLKQTQRILREGGVKVNAF